MKESFDKLARSLAEASQYQVTLLIGIDGAGGSGKSTFARSLAAAFNELGLSAAVVHLDDFYLPSALRPPSLDETKTLADFFDWERLRSQVLFPLHKGQPAQYQRYDWERDALAEWHTLPGSKVVIVEGISTLRNELLDFYDYKVWIESPRPLRLKRGVARDGEDARPVWEQFWMPLEERFFQAHRPYEKADLQVDGSGEESPNRKVFTLLSV